MKLRSASGV
jgi:hypothetical protein